MIRKLLYLFNPDHDLALANQDPNYMSPVLARQLADDLAALPVWYAGEGDFVLTSSGWDVTWLNQVRQYFPVSSNLLTESEVVGKDLLPSPWGWNPSIKKRLRLMGIDEALLPTQVQLTHIRECSSRRLAVDLLPQLRLNEWFCGESFYLSTIEEVESFLNQYSVCVLKAPLSGSGKGLNWCRHGATTPILNWSKHVLKQQSGVAAEPLYEKEVDFAMQFYLAEGKARFRGYSLFQTSASGAYIGNVLADDKEIEQRLAAYIPANCLHLLQTKLEEKLPEYLGNDYKGYLGVDMMVCRFPEGYRLHPCVEVNLRMNMGMTSRLLYDRYVAPGKTGVYKVVYYTSTEELLKEHKRLNEDFPPEIKDGRIHKGYFKLVPNHPEARYSAYMLIQ